MPPHTVVIGVDSSTQSTKAAFVDTATGRLLAVGRAPHVVTGEGGARESDPEVWWRALCDAVAAGLKESGAAPADVVGIAVAGQQHGLVVLDAQGRPLRPALLWNDTRSAPQAAALTAALGGADAWTARTGSVPVAAMTASKWQWLRENEPETARAAAAVRLPHDFLTERLSGRAVTDPGDASGTCWYSTATGAYDPGLLELIGLDAALLPEVAPSGAARVGGLTERAAEALGLPAGIAVAAGTGDNMSAAVGLGLGGAGLLDHPVLSLGTSGTVFAASRTRPASAALSGFAAADGTYLPLACTLNCTLAVDKVAALFGLDRDDAEPGGEAVLLPYLDGERTPDLPTAAGLLTGLRHDTTPRQLLGAAYEGAVVTVLRALDELLRACGLDPADPEVAARPLRLIGGGAQGRVWVETVRRLSGRPVIVPGAGELVALGAAALAASAATGADAVAVAAGWDTGADLLLEAVERDLTAWDRIGSVLERAAGPLLGGDRTG
ncbi:xylulokinase [Streptomyces sp. NBC_00525]|uniref:xylulokinase n=1 Tax=Streptomyces sp. NBC_00525 TaxID=2903660 RepID=UPI002E81404D|nr:xylulokinase [Streptomyces sp. NBC_00525]WUC96988.1 xylulokinase [Streptomyces sp. NBC_00525]